MKRGDEREEEVIEIEVPAEVAQMIRDIANEKGMTIDELMRISLYRYLIKGAIGDLMQAIDAAKATLSTEKLKALCRSILSSITDKSLKRSLKQLFEEKFAIRL